MNVTQSSNNKSRSNRSGNLDRTVSYAGTVLDPGNRTGRNRSNWLKRQKRAIRQTGDTTRSFGGAGQNSVSTTRSKVGNSINSSYTNGSRKASVRNSSKSGTISTKIGSRDLGSYVAAVLDPFAVKQGLARVPSEVPFPSCSTTCTFTGVIYPNTSGNFCAILQPQAGLAGGLEFVYVLNHNSYTAANNYVQTDPQQGNQFGTRAAYLGAGVALKVRTVGAGLKCWYVGKEQDRSGYFVSAFIPKAATRIAADAQPGMIRTGYSEDQLREAQYSTTCNNRAVAEVVYVPRDDVDFDYMNVDASRESSVGVISGFGLPNTACIKWEVVVHLEFIPDPTAATFRLLSTDVSYASKGDASMILGAVTQQNPDYVASPENGDSLFGDISAIFGGDLNTTMNNVVNTTTKYVANWASQQALGALGTIGMSLI